MRTRPLLTVLLVLAVGVCLFLVILGRGRHRDAGVIAGPEIPRAVVERRAAGQSDTADILASRSVAEPPDKQILFGDLHVHSTYSADAFLMSLPLMQGEGAHPVADACDFARYCAALDFWSINDHAETITPRRWRETKEAIRQCNAVAGDEARPDTVAFLGWEWTQVGRTPADHYGHKNVIFVDTDEDKVPRRAIHSASRTSKAMRQGMPIRLRWGPPLLDWPNRQAYLDSNVFTDEIRGVPECPQGIDSVELPSDCSEGAATPGVLYEKLGQWGFDTIVIPHGTTWGLYTPARSTWDKQLTRAEHDPAMQTIIEVYSGHGNSEEYRSWRAADLGADGRLDCPEPADGYEPCCWRAGEIIRARCEDPASADCASRVADARRIYLESGTAGRFTIPGSAMADWMDCGSCPDCFLPSFNYKPGGAVQYIMALSNFETPGPPLRFRFGFIASSDTHQARPGTGYKEYGRLPNTEAFGPRDEKWHRRLYLTENAAPTPAAVAKDPSDPNTLALERFDFERQASFFMTGGLAAVHSEGRSRTDIWQALKRREVYGTSGDHILLWFDLLNGSGGTLPMGGEAELAANPRFRVRAAGSFQQNPGCPEESVNALTPERLESLCRGECYNPGDLRRLITRIEVVRIRPQVYAGEPVEGLIEDPWRVLECPQDRAGCVVEFEDPSFSGQGREILYYVRAIQEPTPAVNGGALRCERDESGACAKIDPCYGDYRTSPDDDCLASVEERAWSSPLFLRPEAAAEH